MQLLPESGIVSGFGMPYGLLRTLVRVKRLGEQVLPTSTVH